MKRIYEPHAYGEGPIAGCFWRHTVGAADNWPALEGESRAEVAILGGGYTGLTAALHLAEAGIAVTLLEARHPGWGASGRNGGFCCLGGAKIGTDALIRRFGADDARRYRDAERQAVTLVRDTLDRLRIDADTHSRGETLLAHSPRAVPSLKAVAQEMRALHGVDCEILDRGALAGAGLASPAFFGAVTTPIGFALNPLKYALGLARAAAGAGARIHGDSAVTAIAADGDGWRLDTAWGRLRARRLIIASNGYSSDDLPRWIAGRYLPIQSNILVTRPLSEAERAAQGWTSGQMCYDTRNLLHYFRLMPDNRMLFGLRGAIRGTPEALEAVRARARADFERIFPAWSAVETPFFWSGLAALSRDLVPFVGPVPGHDGVFAGLCYHGNGVAMGSYAGRLLADLARGRPPDLPLPDLMSRPPRRYPFGRFRRALLAPAYAWYGLRDGG